MFYSSFRLSATKIRVLYAVTGVICAIFIGVAVTPIPEAVVAATQVPTHALGYVIDSNCSPSGCGDSPENGMRIKCGAECLETEGSVCCSIETDAGCIKCF
ncbi:MAG: hypothetical protein OXF48_08765 [Bacteroidetes bacterium]|nr:hypothetical protein [Bacteroidota bacterium]